MSPSSTHFKDENSKLVEDQVDNIPAAEDEMKIALRTEERRLVRRLDERILPLACFLYLFACMSLPPDPC